MIQSKVIEERKKKKLNKYSIQKQSLKEIFMLNLTWQINTFIYKIRKL